MSKMTLTTDGTRDIVVTRRFAASPEAVYRAHIEPSLVQKWLLGGAAGWEDPLRMDGRQGSRVLPDRRVSGVGAFQPDRSCGAHAPA